MSAVLVYMTAADREEAERLARMLVEQRLAACCNIIDPMQAVFRWEDAVQAGPETVLLAKTRQELLEQLTDAVVDAHSYDCPCVVALPIVGGNPQFLRWIETETGE